MYAVEFPHVVIFSIVPVPPMFRDEIRNVMGGKIRVGVSLYVPEDFADWPDGAARPDQVLCVAKGDPDSFEVVKYERDIDPARLERDGRDWQAIGSTTGWVTFIDQLRQLNAIASEGGVEPPDEGEEADSSLRTERVG